MIALSPLMAVLPHSILGEKTEKSPPVANMVTGDIFVLVSPFFWFFIFYYLKSISCVIYYGVRNNVVVIFFLVIITRKCRNNGD